MVRPENAILYYIFLPSTSVKKSTKFTCAVTCICMLYFVLYVLTIIMLFSISSHLRLLQWNLNTRLSLYLLKELMKPVQLLHWFMD